MKFGKLKEAKVKGLKGIKKVKGCKVGSSAPATSKANAYGTKAKKRIETFGRRFK